MEILIEIIIDLYSYILLFSIIASENKYIYAIGSLICLYVTTGLLDYISYNFALKIEKSKNNFFVIMISFFFLSILYTLYYYNNIRMFCYFIFLISG